MNGDTPTVGQLLNGADSGWSHRDLHDWTEHQTGIAVRDTSPHGHYEHHLEVGWWITDRDPDAPEPPDYDRRRFVAPGHAERHQWEIDAITRINQKDTRP